MAGELFAFLKEQDLFNAEGNITGSEFYITMPNTDNKNVQTDSAGRFTYAYKYGRKQGDIQEYVKTVPFSTNNIPAEIINRFKVAIPYTLKLIKFNQHFHRGAVFVRSIF